MAGSALLMLGALYLPPLQTVLRTQSLTGTELLAVLIGACVPVVVGQVMVALRRRSGT